MWLMKKGPILVAILFGSDSDADKMKKGAEVLEDFAVTYDVYIASADRNPEDVKKFVFECHKRGCVVFIAGAGIAALLPGVVASWTHLPVIGVPLTSGSSAPAFNGLDSLLSIVQKPSGSPLAVVSVDGAANAAHLAIRIVSLVKPDLMERVKEFKVEQAKKVRSKNKGLWKELYH